VKSKSITLLSKGCDLLPVRSGAIGLMFECAPDGQAYNVYPNAIALKKLIGEFSETKANAFRLARKLLANEPKCRGIQQLSVFEELVIRELQRAYHLLHLYTYLTANGFTQCNFIGSTHFAGGLQLLAVYLGSNLVVTVDAASRENTLLASIKRSFKRVSESGFSSRTLSHEWWQILERLDPYHRRNRVVVNENLVSGTIWFYTTANTFSRIGLLFEPYFPQPFQYLVENPLTGGVPLTATGQAYTSVYQFGHARMEPTLSEVNFAKEVICTHLLSVALTQNEAVALQLLLNSSFLFQFISRHLPRGLFLSSLFEYWASITYPEALVVGNPVFEGYALHAARQRNIPTVLLQHGILGDYCQFSDPPVDHYIVRGEFWKNFLADIPRSRAVILDPPDRKSGGSAQVTAQRKSILFLTSTHELEEFQHMSDLDGILSVLLLVASEQKCELIVRVHPLEDIGYYRKIMDRLKRQDGGEFKLTYSQGVGLDGLLERSAVAVMYSSTVFLDCLRYRVPIVSFAWYNFSYKQQIEEYGVFYFARHLAEFSELLKKGLKGDLIPYSHNTTPFLAETPVEKFKAVLASLVQRIDI